jgi:3-methylcrotonyl-CoA carboxylase alpha subunit
MFERILIANRGEIACRIIETCRRLGVETVAVYSDADRGARHVRMADRGVHIGPAEAADSYLRIDRIVEAARETGAQAVHPGYGFLSENARFAAALHDAGLVLIGPRAETIEAMGSKAQAKAIMAEAGVPLVPGYHGDEQDDDTMTRQAGRVGFPLMLKAAAGGGGKGMRIVRSEAEFGDALAAARREARAAFGDDRMILERYVQRPRHIEAQVFGDAHGNYVHLFERDCSSQRRHQKVIEEAPAADLDPSIREQLLEAAVRAAQAVDYLGAGTVEFLVDERGFYFLEMNTRLQVEHPVTERVTGEDLVEWQLRVAAGEPLPRRQEDIACRGHAIEARIYAEDPAAGFLPDSGTVRTLTLPDSASVRVDRGVDAGDVVSVHYDPMIAKLVVSAGDRAVCLSRLRRALAACRIDGLTTNLGFLLKLATSDAFSDATVDTGLLDRALDDILDAAAEPPVEVIAVAAGAFLAAAPQPPAASPWDIDDGWRSGGNAPQRLDLEIGAHRIELECTASADGGLTIERGNDVIDAGVRFAGPDACLLELDGRSHAMRVHGDGRVREIVWAGHRWPAVRHRRFEAVESAAAGSGRVVAPMPGKVIEVTVAEGDSVREGDTVALMEAMKMELSIKAECDGTVSTIQAAAGDVVEADALLLEIE